jgi:monoterpene epsilon-lactone hydrolase
MLRLLFHLLRAAARAAVARQRRGPLRPSWSFGYESIVGMLRSYMAWLSGLDIPTQRRIAASLASRSPEQRHVTTERISAGGVRAAWFTPPDADPARVVVYLHGGSFTFGSAQQDTGFIARIAVGARQRVLGVDYRLAPEHPCPAAIDDTLQVLDWLREQGFAASSLSLVGLSAGGGVALAALMAARDRGRPLPRCAALLSPGIDLQISGGSFVRNAPYDFFGAVDLPATLAAYIGELDVRDPRVSPLYGDPTGLPPLLLHAGGAEMLRDSVVRFAEKARARHVDVELGVFEDMVHGFHPLGNVHEDVGRAVERVCDFLRRDMARPA